MSIRVDNKMIKKIAKILNASDFDVAGGLREDEINNFLNAHYNQQSPGGVPGGIYSGAGKLDELGLKYEYTVDASIVATIAPFTSRRFATLMCQWLGTVPEFSAFGQPPAVLQKGARGTIYDTPPPNIQLKAPKMTLKVEATDGSINPPAILSFSMTATGYVAASTAAGVATVKVVPIAVRLDNPGTFQKDLVIMMKKLGFGDQPGKDRNCISLQKLILHIVNAVIAPKLSSFVKEFSFPVPIQLFNNVELLSVALEVVDKLVVVLGKIGLSSAAEARLILPESLAPAELKKAKERLLAEASAQFKAGAGEKKKKASMRQMKALASYPNRGVFLLMHQRFFQILADAFLVTSAAHRGGGSFGPIFYSYGWSMKTWGPVATVSGNRLLLSVNCEGAAGASAGIHTHCGDISAGLSAKADALPARFAANFYVDNQNRELWTSLAAQPFTLSWSIGGLPWPLSAAVAGLLDIFTDLGVTFIAALGLRWKHKLTTLPDSFPGTHLKYDLSLDRQVVSDPSTGALMVAGSVKFKS